MKKRSSKNLKIRTRIIISSVLAIVIPLIIIGSFLAVFVHMISDELNLSTVIDDIPFYENEQLQNVVVQQFRDLFLGRTGIVVLVIAVLFVVAIVVLSVITTKTIVAPVKKIAEGANEVAKGNLDYKIDYKSTNELGQTVEIFNEMTRKLKKSIEEQQQAQEQRKELVAGIAHDLRTPLTCVRGYAEGIIDGIADTPEKQEKYLKTICSSINDTERILDDLLTISRLELSGFELDRTDVRFKEFVDDGAEEIELILSKEGFDFIFENNCGENTIVFLDTDQFTRVISNIISNCIKYTRSNVKGKVEMIVTEYEKSVMIEISDNGIGVDRESLTKIFDIMYRTDPARTKVSDGSGLGLAVCKQAVELHGGSIWASSKEGEGLSIFISLPKKEVVE